MTPALHPGVFGGGPDHRVGGWAGGAAVSLAVHGVVLALLALALQPDPFPEPPRPPVQVQVRSEPVERGSALPVAPDAPQAPGAAITAPRAAAPPLPPATRADPVTGPSAPVAAVPPPMAQGSVAPTAPRPATPTPAPPMLATAPPEPLAASPAPTALSAAPPPAATMAVLPPAPALPNLTPASPASPAIPPPRATPPATAGGTALAAAPPPVDPLVATPPADALAAAPTLAPALPATAPAAALAQALPPPAVAATPAAPAARPATPAAPPAPVAARVPAGPAQPPAAATQPATAALALPSERQVAALVPESTGLLPAEAVAAFLRPGDIMPGDAGVLAVRDGIAAALAQFPCARLQSGFNPETGSLDLRGHIPEPAMRDAVIAGLQAQLGPGVPVTGDLLILPRPQCQMLAAFDALGLPQSSEQFTNARVIGPDAHVRDYRFAEGDRLELELTAPDYPAYVLVDYFDADGNVLHLQPNPHVPAVLVPPRSSLSVGRATPDQPALAITIAPPFGQEIAVAFALSAPVFDDARPLIEPAAPYLADLGARIAAARAADPDFRGEWVYFFVTTAPR